MKGKPENKSQRAGAESDAVVVERGGFPEKCSLVQTRNAGVTPIAPAVPAPVDSSTPFFGGRHEVQCKQSDEPAVSKRPVNRG